MSKRVPAIFAPRSDKTSPKVGDQTIHRRVDKYPQMLSTGVDNVEKSPKLLVAYTTDSRRVFVIGVLSRRVSADNLKAGDAEHGNNSNPAKHKV